MDILRTLTRFIDRLANVLEAARITAGQNTLSAQRVAEARLLLLEDTVETPTSRDTRTSAPIATAAPRAA